jgi:4-hydroxybenzoate polyprenyltransferase
MLKRSQALIALLRPFQYYKAVIIWLPVFFHDFNAIQSNAKVLLGITLVWMLTSSLVYVLNDLVDLKEDRTRPDRQQRPLVSGAIQPGTAWALASALLITLALSLTCFPHRLALYVSLYLALNLGYSLGLKRHMGLQQAIIAIGFWLRLQSGGTPLVDVPLTPWAALFTLGLAYYLNCLKGMHQCTHDTHRPYRFAMGLGAGLAGSLALASLVAICLKRGVEGTMHLPELPPLFCLIGMHRTAYQSFNPRNAKEQSKTFFGDWVTLLAMVLFAASFIWG